MEYIVKCSGPLELLGQPVERLSEQYAIVERTPAEAEALLRLPAVEYLERAQTVFPYETVGRDRVSPAPALFQAGGRKLDGRGVALGVLDSGLDLAHPEFADPADRLLAAWDMTLPGDPPPGFRKGTAYRQGQSGGPPPLTDGSGHGTAVTGLAAGRGGVAPAASIIAVKLGRGDAVTTDIMRGLRFVIDAARAAGMPCVINLSYGTNGGSHRGQSLFEGFVDACADEWKTLIVAATGNEGDAGHHAAVRLRAGQRAPVAFTVGPGLERVYLTVWDEFVDEIGLELTLPDGRTTGSIRFANGTALFVFGGIRVTVFRREPTHYRIDREILFILQAQGGLPAGRWTLTLTGEQVVVGRVDLWLPTVEETGRSTVFDEPEAADTATLPSTAARVLAVGGYRPGVNAVSPFSGRGGRQESGALPDVVAPAEEVRAPRAGGGYSLFTGTSMAAPHAAGAAALMMQWGVVLGRDPFLYGQRIRALMRRYALRSPGLTYPDPRWGFGRLDIAATLAGMTEQPDSEGVIL